MAITETDAENRRLRAIQRKREEMIKSRSMEREQSAIISKSLRGVQSNRIVFSDSDEEENVLFNQDDKDEEDVEKLFKVKGEYEGEDGQALLSRQREINNVTGGDKRFQMDATFLDKDVEDTVEKKESNLEKERDRVMGLLSGMLNVQPKKVNNSKRRTDDVEACNVLDERYSFFSKHAWTLQNVPRYDPTLSKHSELEISRSIDPLPKKKKRKIDQTTKSFTEKIPTNTKRFIKTGESWKGMFSTEPVKTFGFLSASSKKSGDKVSDKGFKFNFSDTFSGDIKMDNEKDVKASSVTVVDVGEEDDDDEEEETSSSEDEENAPTTTTKQKMTKGHGILFWKGNVFVSSNNDGDDENDVDSRLERRKRLTKDFKRKNKIAKRLRR
jgi:hypothetical protein